MIVGESGGATPVGTPVQRWSSRAHTIAGIEAELARIWSSTPLTTPGDAGEPERHVAARTSVMNLVVIARRQETAEHASAIIKMLTGRHPTRTLVVSSADPDGPSWLDAQIQALCVLPRADAAETCAEFIYLTAGGESGRHLAAIVAPLLIHDLPVMLWWPGDPPLASRAALDLLEAADRLVVDGSHWSGDGLDRLGALAAIVASRDLGGGAVAVSDFAMIRQSRWREAIASTFDRAELRPYLSGLTRILVRYASHPASGAFGTNLIKPLYHVAWLASRLDLRVVAPLERTGADDDPRTGLGPSLSGTLRAARRRVAVTIEPLDSPMPPGTTLAVELSATRRSGRLDVAVTAEAEAVIVRSTLDGRSLPERRFMAPRRTEAELLGETVESVGRDPVATAALLTAAQLAGRR